MNSHSFDQVAACADIVRSKWDHRPRVGVVLGTGLGGFVDEMQIEATFERGDLPHFPPATAMSHRGRLVCGRIGSLPIVVMEGRFHVYEGHPLDQITLPVRLMRALGIELLILSNASGGLNPDFHTGDIVVLTDHINLMGLNPLIGPNDDRFGPRFPDISETYSPHWRAIALNVAARAGLKLQQGVYVAVTGPNYETKAEIRFFRLAGGDVIGMSTVPEALVAAHAGLPVLAFSVVTNECLAPTTVPVTGEDVVAVANEAGTRLRRLLLGILAEFGGEARSAMDRTPKQDAAIDDIRNRLVGGCAAEEFAGMRCPVCDGGLGLFVHPRGQVIFVRCVASSVHMGFHAEGVVVPDWWAAYRCGGWLSDAELGGPADGESSFVSETPSSPVPRCC